MARRLLRTAKLAALQASLQDAQRAVAPALTQPPLPPGMRYLTEPREALAAETLDIAFDLFTFWRLLLGFSWPTKASLVEAGRRLRAIALWQLAIRAQQQGKPLPLKDGKPEWDVPASYVSKMQSDQLFASLKNASSHRNQNAGRLVQRDVTTDGPDGQGQEQEQPFAPELAYDLKGFETILDFWDTWGSITPEQIADILYTGELSGRLPVTGSLDELQALVWGLIQDSSLMPIGSYQLAGNVLDLPDIISTMQGIGWSDAEVAGFLTAWWQTQAGSVAATFTSSAVGVAGTFELRDPAFYDYLRNQAGYKIVQIYDMTRKDIAEDLWQAVGGPGGVGLYNMPALGKWIADRYRLELENTTMFSADWRGYMIAVTETARAETFGTFVSLYTQGAQNKIWIVSAGACELCQENADEGPVPLTAWFPTGVMAPPQHPICRCSVSAAIPDTFSPDDWQPRSPSDLAPLLTDWTGPAWPDVDLSSYELELADMPQTTREVDQRRVQLTHGEQQLLWAELARIVHDVGEQWCHEAHIRKPRTEAELKSLAKRLKTPDEVPDAREADEHCWHQIKTRFAAAIKAAAEAAG